MSDLLALLRSAAALRRRGEPALLATVVSVKGSSYREPGARMLLADDRWLAGSISGGCLERDVVRKGWWRTREGAPCVVTYDARADEDGWGFNLGCDGVVEVLLERAGVAGRIDPLRFLSACFEAQRPGVMVTVFRSQVPEVPVGARLTVGPVGSPLESDLDGAACDVLIEAAGADSTRSERLSVCGSPVEVLVETVRPAPRLFVFGSGHDAEPLVRVAAVVGWETFVCEPRDRGGTRERFAFASGVLTESLDATAARIAQSDRPLAVVMAHDREQDREALRMLLASRAEYVGVLGPRRRTAALLDELGVDRTRPFPSRLHAPVGLDLGAKSPHEIALAVVAEALASLTGAPATSLRARGGPIHRSAAS